MSMRNLCSLQAYYQIQICAQLIFIENTICWIYVIYLKIEKDLFYLTLIFDSSSTLNKNGLKSGVKILAVTQTFSCFFSFLLLSAGLTQLCKQSRSKHTASLQGALATHTNETKARIKPVTFSNPIRPPHCLWSLDATVRTAVAVDNLLTLAQVFRSSPRTTSRIYISTQLQKTASSPQCILSHNCAHINQAAVVQAPMVFIVKVATLSCSEFLPHVSNFEFLSLQQTQNDGIFLFPLKLCSFIFTRLQLERDSPKKTTKHMTNHENSRPTSRKESIAKSFDKEKAIERNYRIVKPFKSRICSLNILIRLYALILQEQLLSCRLLCIENISHFLCTVETNIVSFLGTQNNWKLGGNTISPFPLFCSEHNLEANGQFCVLNIRLFSKTALGVARLFFCMPDLI